MQNRMLCITMLFALLGITNNAMAASDFYNTGYRLANSLVKTAWNGVGRDCRKLDDVFRIMKRSKNRVVKKMGVYSSDSASRSFAYGYAKGVEEGFDEIGNDCFCQTSNFGYLVVEILYCEFWAGCTQSVRYYPGIFQTKCFGPSPSSARQSTVSRHFSFEEGQELASQQNVRLNVNGKNCSIKKGFASEFANKMMDVYNSTDGKAKEFAKGYVSGMKEVVAKKCPLFTDDDLLKHLSDQIKQGISDINCKRRSDTCISKWKGDKFKPKLKPILKDIWLDVINSR